MVVVVVYTLAVFAVFVTVTVDAGSVMVDAGNVVVTVAVTVFV
jgi:hypothetical protein